MHHPTDRITHTTAFVIPVVEHWLCSTHCGLESNIYIYIYIYYGVFWGVLVLFFCFWPKYINNVRDGIVNYILQILLNVNNIITYKNINRNCMFRLFVHFVRRRMEIKQRNSIIKESSTLKKKMGEHMK